ncbi:MAG: hypothetical protein EOP49_14965 [Sphingobacteriales bacterium]|nr:MAG: hypothetical protein EOP49_14965 [Sphingobacteriales bacterium]
MRGITRLIMPCLLLAACITTSAQVDSVKVTSMVPDSADQRYKITVLAPLYLDSAFDASGNYRYDKAFPRFLTPGMEFYQGVQLAIDTLQKQGLDLDINIFDSRAARSTLKTIFEKPEFEGTDIIIGHVNMADAQWLAQTARNLDIPFVNVNFPNEAGVTDNPDYIMLNSTLYTHCEGLYKFMQKNYALAPITVFRKKGVQEDRLNTYLREIEKTTSSVPLKMKYVTLSDNFTPEELTKSLDAGKTNIVFAASLDVNFATRLAQQLAPLNTTTHASILVGMPNWDAINFAPFKGLEVIYSTPFYIAPSDSLAGRVTRSYISDNYVRPGEMVFRGYETVYQVAHLLLEDDSTPIQQRLAHDKYKLFYDYNILPVLNKKTNKTDYYENKKLFFVKKMDGVIKAVY